MRKYCYEQTKLFTWHYRFRFQLPQIAKLKTLEMSLNLLYSRRQLFLIYNLYRCETLFSSIFISLDYINDSGDQTSRFLECFQRVRTPTRSQGTRHHVVTLYLRLRRYCPRLCLSMPTDQFLILQHNCPIVTVLTICARHDSPCLHVACDTTMFRLFASRRAHLILQFKNFMVWSLT